MYLQFDGAQTDSTVFLDGDLLGHHASGYTPFDFELTAPQRAALAAKALAATGKDGAASVLAVRVDATKPDGWWYDGGGLYRHVRLVVVPVVHIALHGGVYAPSAVTGPIDATRLTADVELYPNVTVTAPSSGGSSDAGISVAATCVLHDASGKEVGSSTGKGVALPGANTSIALPTIAVKDALLWTIDRPSLYTVACTIGNDAVSNTRFFLCSICRGTLAPRTSHIIFSLPLTPPHTTPPLTPSVFFSVFFVSVFVFTQAAPVSIGFRKTHWDANTGFLLNDVPTKILGAANHQDFAGVGVAVPDALQVTYKRG